LISNVFLKYYSIGINNLQHRTSEPRVIVQVQPWNYILTCIVLHNWDQSKIQIGPTNPSDFWFILYGSGNSNIELRSKDSLKWVHRPTFIIIKSIFFSVLILEQNLDALKSILWSTTCSNTIQINIKYFYMNEKWGIRLDLFFLLEIMNSSPSGHNMPKLNSLLLSRLLGMSSYFYHIV
jgi:hypothetical protein